MGKPPSSLIGLVGALFFAFAEGGAMRVPSPAAGMITNTFIGAISIVQAEGGCGKSGTSTRGPLYSTARSMANGAIFFGASEVSPVGAVTGGTVTGGVDIGFESWRLPLRSSHLPKIILPAVVCRTEVTEISMVLPIILRALSTTTMV